MILTWRVRGGWSEVRARTITTLWLRLLKSCWHFSSGAEHLPLRHFPPFSRLFVPLFSSFLGFDIQLMFSLVRYWWPQEEGGADVEWSDLPGTEDTHEEWEPPPRPCPSVWLFISFSSVVVSLFHSPLLHHSMAPPSFLSPPFSICFPLSSY